jgi:hypothetical protein
MYENVSGPVYENVSEPWCRTFRSGCDPPLSKPQLESSVDIRNLGFSGGVQFCGVAHLVRLPHHDLFLRCFSLGHRNSAGMGAVSGD